MRTKGSLFLLAQVTGGEPALGRAAAEALEAIERDYYYDLSAGATGAISKALTGANRLLYHSLAMMPCLSGEQPVETVACPGPVIVFA